MVQSPSDYLLAEFDSIVAALGSYDELQYLGGLFGTGPIFQLKDDHYADCGCEHGGHACSHARCTWKAEINDSS